MNLTEMLTQRAKEQGDRLFAAWHDQKLTYAQMEGAAAKTAAGLAGRGIGQGDVVAMLVPNIPAFLITYFAVQKLGAVALPINLLLRPPEIAYILSDSKAKMIVALDMMVPLVEAVRDQVPHVEQVVVMGPNVPSWALPFARVAAGDPAGLTPVAADADALCTLLYTSGTTGVPKGAMLTHRNLLHQGKMIQDVFGVTPQDRNFLVLPLFHIFGLGVVTMGALVSGSAVVLQEKFDPDAVLKALVEYRVTLLYAVPAMYIALLQQAAKGSYTLPDTLRACLCGAAPLPVETVHQFQEAFHTVIVEGYGLTETAGATCVNPWQGKVKIGSVGPVIDGSRMKLVDENGRPAGSGSVGEIAVQGDNVFSGYLNQPAATAESLRNGWFFTGDMATMDEDGYFTIVDRKQDLIIVGGENVYPREVEEALYAFPGVVEAAVVGISHPKLVEVPKAVIALAPAAKASVEDIGAFLELRLAKFKIPRTIEFRETLPKSATGKILRRLLRDA
jgi:long-chain acyl-CoA synthetase